MSRPISERADCAREKFLERILIWNYNMELQYEITIWNKNLSILLKKNKKMELGRVTSQPTQKEIRGLLPSYFYKGIFSLGK